MVGIRIDPISNRGGRIALDWIRVYQPAAADRVTVTGPASANVIVDQRLGPANSDEEHARPGQRRYPDELQRDRGRGRLAAAARHLAGRHPDKNGGTTYSGTPLTVTSPMPRLVLWIPTSSAGPTSTTWPAAAAGT